jgi:hypothetical protein
MFARANCVVPKSLRRTSIDLLIHFLGHVRVPRIGIALSASIASLSLFATLGVAQTSVVTEHNDNARTGANMNETILTPANVNSSTFGRLFSSPTDGYVYAQPLYLPGVTMGSGTLQAGTVHNVIFIATEHDSVYAFDADNNGGANANPLWHVSLLDTLHGAAAGASTVPSGDVSSSDISPEIGITSTPVIDATTNTIYVVSKSLENGGYVQRLHALDVTTGNEKFGGPTALVASVPGQGNGSSGGVLNFDPKWENQRAALLLQSGIVYMGFGAHGDNGPWHGWILGYNATTLRQTGAYCVSPNGIGGGIWMSGAGLAGDIPDPANHPFGRMFVATGNGSFDATQPFTNNMDYGDSHVRFDLVNGSITVQDSFTPANQLSLDLSDTDVASGGVVLLPDQTAGGHARLLVQAGKEGRIYLDDRDAMGEYHANGDAIVEEIPPYPATSGFPVGGLWSAPAYWNGNVYIWARYDNLKAFSLTNGLLSTSATSMSAATTNAGNTPSVSANGNSNGIVWDVDSFNGSFGQNGVLYAHLASNVATLLYASTQNAIRDPAGFTVKFAVPTIVNGKVYIGVQSAFTVFGLLNGQPQAATPAFNPPSESFTGSVSVSISDTTPGAVIYYTTNGSTPTTASSVYSGPITVTSTETIKAVASAAGDLQSPVASATYTLPSQAATPILSPAPGVYTSAQIVTITTTSSGATIYYTTDGSTPTTSSTKYTAPVTVNATSTLRAIASGNGFTSSVIAGGLYTIQISSTSANFSSGFAGSSTAITFNGSTKLDDTRLQLTDGGTNEASSAFLNTPLNIQAFTSTFAFQLSNPLGEGITFTIQGNSPTALGQSGGGLGYGANTTGGTGGIPKSVAIKLDYVSNQGEGTDSTGLYQNGAAPTVPALDMTSSGIKLVSGDTISAQLTYDGAILALTLSDNVNQTSYSTSWPINIPAVVGGNAAYVGFTGATSTLTSSQKIETWTFTSNAPPPKFSLAAGTYFGSQTVTISDAGSGAPTIYYTTDGSAPTTSSTKYTGAITVSTSETLSAIAVAAGYGNSSVAHAAYVIQVGSPTINFGGGFASTTGLQLNGSAAWNQSSSRLRLTDANAPGSESGSIFFTTPVNVQSFSNNFSFQLSSANADGFTFTIQNNSATGLGPYGGGLGYGYAGSTPFLRSVAVKFDLYNNSGEGNDSTGMYTDGATPDLPSLDMTSSGVNLHSGDIMNVQMSYDGTTLSWTVNDSTTGKSFSASAAVNIPSVVGGTTAYFGFTGGTGGETAIQELLSWTYTPGAPAQSPCATPTFSPAGGTYTSVQTVSISDTTPGATIRYTTNGTTPSASSAIYASPISVASSETLEAIAVATGFTNSAVGTAAYIINNPQTAATPTFSPAAGTYTSAQTVTISDGTSGATIYFTTNGTTPTTSSTKYTSPVPVSSSQTIKAIAAATGFNNSAVASAAYVINIAQTAATPTFSPTAGTYTSPQSVTISDATPGATFYYTTDGSTPTTASTKYATPVSVASSATLKAIAVATGFNNSAVGSASYVINLAQTAATPTFSPVAGTYTTSQSVVISDTTAGASIYYTTNGTTPTTASTKYTTPISVSASETLKAIAVATGFNNSGVAAAAYTIQSGPATISFASGFTSSAGLTLNGGATVVSSRLRLTDGGPTEARSVFYSTPVNIQSFTNNFSFQISSGAGDGFAFVIQGDSTPAWVGPTGGGLGYGAASPGGAAGIPLSIAVKFDIYNNNGEGADSTGLYINGASPTIPAIDMTSSGVNLSSGDVFNVQMTYNGTTLAWTITDATTGKSFSTSVPLNLPNIVESPAAYVGFTGGTGGSVATQDILTWSYTGTPIADAKLPIVFQTESLTGVSSGPSYGPTSWPGFSNGNGTILQSTAVGNSVTIPINVPVAGTYDIRVGAKNTSARAIMQLSVNGTNVGSPADEYSAVGYTWGEFNLETVSLPAGSQPFKFTVTGKNAASSAYQLTFDYITLIPQ